MKIFYDKCLSYFLEHRKLHESSVAIHTKHSLSQSHESKIQVKSGRFFWIKMFHKAAMKLLAGAQIISRFKQLNVCLQIHLCSGWQDSDSQWLLTRDISYCQLFFFQYVTPQNGRGYLRATVGKAQDSSRALPVT